MTRKFGQARPRWPSAICDSDKLRAIGGAHDC
jgi:hypothetical protein